MITLILIIMGIIVIPISVLLILSMIFSMPGWVLFVAVIVCDVLLFKVLTDRKK